MHISKAVIKKENKYLLLLRSPDAQSFPNTWDFAGGKDDPGESNQESVIREVREETAFDIKVGVEVKIADYLYHPDQFTDIDVKFHYFVPFSITGEIQLSSEHTEFRWFTEEEIVTLPVHPAVSLFFQD